MASGGSWSVYWYNGLIVSSEIARGLDILELAPSEFLSENEIEAARTVTFDHFNVQGQQMFVWPATFALARAYTDQLERSGGLNADGVVSVRNLLALAEKAGGSQREDYLTELATWLGEEGDGAGAGAGVIRGHPLSKGGEGARQGCRAPCYRKLPHKPSGSQ
jgi:hypothetical protein